MKLPISIRVLVLTSLTAHLGFGSILYPDFADKVASMDEVKPPAEFTSEEKGVLASAKKLTTDEIFDLIEAYERMGNVAMQESLSRLLLERVPNHPLAKQLQQGITDQPEIRRPEYLQQQAAEVLTASGSLAILPASTEARSLLEAKKPEQAVALLEALKRTTFPGKNFPYEEDLAYGYMDLGRWKEAEEALKLAQSHRNVSGADPMGKQLGLVKIERQIAEIRESSYTDPAAALAASEKLLKELPNHPSVIGFNVECLHYAGKNQEALGFLLALKASNTERRAFPYERLLGHAHQQLKQWDEATVCFETVRDNAVFSVEARNDAAKMIKSISIAKTGEAALLGAVLGDWEKADSMIVELEKSYPDDIEVFSYRCAFLARSGMCNEALDALTMKREQLATGGRPFILQDTVIDVQLAKKDFEQARAAAQEILDNPAYNWSMRRRALDAGPGIRRAELLEEGLNALLNRRVQTAKQAAKTLAEEFGTDARELKLLLAEIHLSQNKTTEAVAEFENLEKSTPEGQPFEAKSSLATGQLLEGRVAEAMEAFQEILANHRAYTPFEGMQARWLLRSAIPQVKPAIEVTADHRSEQDGTITRAETSYTGPWWGAWRAKVYTHADFLQLKREFADFSRPSNNERYEAGAWIQRRFKGNVMGELLVGSGQNDPVFGARVGSFAGTGMNWSAAFTGNTRNTESIPLESLDARENRAELAYGRQLAGPWNVDVRAFMNWVRVATEDVGRGYGGSAALEYVMQAQTDRRGEIALGYLGEYRRFSTADDASLLAQLIDPETNRHGVTLAYRRIFRDSWRLNAQAGAFYAFDESSFQYMAALGVQHYFSDDLLIYLDLRFDSNSRSALGDTGAFAASVGMQKTF